MNDLLKIRGADLQRLAAEDADVAPVSVLIELDLPRRQIEMQKVTRRGVAFNLPARVAEPTADEAETTERQIEEAHARLADLLGAPPRYLSTSHSFVARVTPDQLRAIARVPQVKAIWPNRELRPFVATR